MRSATQILEINKMDESETERRESPPVAEVLQMAVAKRPPRLLRVLSADSNLQTISLPANSDHDSLATISLAEIGGIPQRSGGTTAALDPNLLIGLSPESLSVMATGFQFLTSTSSAPELSIGCSEMTPSSVAGLPSTSVGDPVPLTRSSDNTDVCTTSVTDTHPVSACLTSYSSTGEVVSKNEKSPSVIRLTPDSIGGDPGESGIMGSRLIVTHPRDVATVSCSPPNESTYATSQSRSNTRKRENVSGIRIFSGAGMSPGAQRMLSSDDGDELPHGSSMPVQFLNESQPGTSGDGISPVSPTPETCKPQTPTTPSSILGETVSRVGIRESPGEPDEDQGTLIDSSGGGMQYVSITVPNVAINSSGQLVISHVSLLQAPPSSSFIPLVTQSAAAPVVSQTALPDSTSEGTAPPKKKRKGGWPKGKKRNVSSPGLDIPLKTTPTTSYMIFFKENRDRLQRENPDLSFQGLKKLMGSSWAALTEDEKQVYTKKAAKLKKEYLSEVRSHSQTDAYQTLLRREAAKKLKNTEGDFPDSDYYLFMTDFNLVDEDPLNPNELYCKVCDQYFNTIHNKKEHLSGRMHITTVKEKLKAYYQAADSSSDPDQDSPEETLRRGLDDIGDLMGEILELNSQRELEIRSLKDDTMDNLMKNMQLSKELKDLRETYRKLQSDLKNLKTIECSLQAKLNGLRLLLTLFGVIHFE